MKNPLDPRHKKRQQLVEELFMIDFHKQKVSPIAQKIFSKRSKADENVKKAAPEFLIDKINRVDLAILRLPIYELTIEKKEPAKVILNDAVELAKKDSRAPSLQFI